MTQPKMDNMLSFCIRCDQPSLNLSNSLGFLHSTVLLVDKHFSHSCPFRQADFVKLTFPLEKMVTNTLNFRKNSSFLLYSLYPMPLHTAIGLATLYLPSLSYF